MCCKPGTNHAHAQDGICYLHQCFDVAVVNPFNRCGSWSSLVVQWVKDLALSLQHLGSLLWLEFDPWLGNFCMPWVQPKYIYIYEDLKVGCLHVHMAFTGKARVKC